MISQIQPLSTELVHLIAAGEVIDSPAAVVRELVENALDDQATRIGISIWPEFWKIRVADNGRGMALADLEQAAAPHSTSKIRTRSDLWAIGSLGFRGEALHSLSQLANLEICSRQPDQIEGWQVSYDRLGQAVKVTNLAIAPGTIVTVSNLFQNWPTRRDSLPNLSQQLRAIQLTIQQLALCHPQVTWQVEQRDRPWFTLWPGPSAKAILPQLLRDTQPADLREVSGLLVPPADKDTSPATASTADRATVLIGLPDRCHRRRPDWVKVAINGRVVQLPELEHTLINCFQRLLPRDRYPVCFAHLQIAPAYIDWNRHPAKSAVYLHHLEHWQAQIAQAVAQGLKLGPYSLLETASNSQINPVIKAAEAEGVYGSSRRVSAADATAGELRAIAQVHGRYILAESPTGICLIEQHIAHERVLYEQLCDRWKTVPQEPPIVLSGLTTAQVQQLQSLSLSIEPFGEDLWAVRSVPESLSCRSDCSEALIELSLGGNLEAALVATACRSAIRNGVALSQNDMQILLDQWQQSRHPRTCPHGRPICLTLQESSLSRFFRRHWVIGKSHGLEPPADKA
ncbi:MAG: DNA mismatch repair endonuclease MutL [Leptolyngbyaceae cyanobacterium SL_1_1]|nr:DNA mismatch repair endonuclease MutL [Leptolyngbyaceae cyanobacterium RM1_1_2]NJO08693.1 DNA mismatch repair endonuclease MutL [Leptolyngbyaceae cyanobacterium SL_1_1]